MGYATEYLCPAGTTIIGRKGSINNPLFIGTPFWNVDTAFGFNAKSNYECKLLYYFCLSFDFNKLNKGTTLPSLVKSDLLHFTTDEFTTTKDNEGNTKKLYVLKFKDTFDGQKWYETSEKTDKKAHSFNPIFYIFVE